MYCIEWNNISVPGFRTRTEAQNYIENIAKRIAPEFTYRITESIPSKSLNNPDILTEKKIETVHLFILQ